MTPAAGAASIITAPPQPHGAAAAPQPQSLQPQSEAQALALSQPHESQPHDGAQGASQPHDGSGQQVGAGSQQLTGSQQVTGSQQSAFLHLRARMRANKPPHFFLPHVGAGSQQAGSGSQQAGFAHLRPNRPAVAS
jgi:hypothetical protein